MEKGCWGGMEVELLKVVAHLSCEDEALAWCMAVKASPAQSNCGCCWMAVMVDKVICCWCGGGMVCCTGLRREVPYMGRREGVGGRQSEERPGRSLCYGWPEAADQGSWERGRLRAAGAKIASHGISNNRGFGSMRN